MTHYTTIVAITLMTLAALCVVVRENNRMSETKRRLCYVEFALIGAAALAGWLVTALDHVDGLPWWAIPLAKWADYVLTPLAGGAIVWQLRVHDRWENALNALLAFNVAFQTLALVTGQMVSPNAYDRYTNESLRIAYMGICLALFAIAAIQLAHYGRPFGKRNQGSLYLTLALVFAGAALQELLGEGARVAHLSLALGAALLYIRNGEFFQLVQDKGMEAQRELLMKDDLTGIGSRRAYAMRLEECGRQSAPNDLAAFCVDINGLKETNDAMGHAAGDELICAAADCVRRTFSPEGDCYRTGGDEFVVLASMNKERANQAVAALERNAHAWRDAAGNELRLACGYAIAARTHRACHCLRPRDTPCATTP